MTDSPATDSPATDTNDARFPLVSLLILALAGFVTILTETLPAGLLPQISADLDVSEALAGQLVSLYAIGSLLAAIPLTSLTQNLRRRPLLLAAIGGFVVANSITTFSGNYALTMAARFVGGIAAGLLWALLAGYAARMVPDRQKGRAIAVAMVGTPLALSLGVPAATLLGTLLGWRICFGIMTLLALALMAWARLQLPDYAGQPAGDHLSLRRVFTVPGVRPVLAVILTFVLAHTTLYTYIAPLLAAAGLGERTGWVLFLFGSLSLLGIWIIGALIDRHLRLLTLACTVVFGLAVLVLGVANQVPALVYAAVAAWGLAFGGAPTLFTTAIVNAAGDAADVAQSMAVTAWNLAIAGGGILGGVLLEHRGVSAFPPALLILLGTTLLVVATQKRHAFPARQG